MWVQQNFLLINSIVGDGGLIYQLHSWFSINFILAYQLCDNIRRTPRTLQNEANLSTRLFELLRTVLPFKTSFKRFDSSIFNLEFSILSFFLASVCVCVQNRVKFFFFERTFRKSDQNYDQKKIKKFNLKPWKVFKIILQKNVGKSFGQKGEREDYLKSQKWKNEARLVLWRTKKASLARRR